MIYSLIPPILIVISLAGIVIFLIKKAPVVAKLKDDSFSGGLISEKKSLWSRITKKEKREDEVDFKHKILLFLEKTTQKLKVFLLKLENIFSAWGEVFRNKRKAREEEKMAQLEEIVENKVENKNVLEKEEIEIKREVKEVNPVQIIKPVQPVKPVQPIQQTIKSIRPIEEEKKVKLRIKKEKKEVLEKILVERIATNPKDVEAYEKLGEYYLETGHWDYAKECFKQVLKINPKSSSVKKKMKKLEKMFGE